MFSLSSSTKRYVNELVNLIFKAAATFVAWFFLLLLGIASHMMFSYLAGSFLSERMELILQTLFGGFLIGLALLILLHGILDIAHLIRAGVRDARGEE